MNEPLPAQTLTPPPPPSPLTRAEARRKYVGFPETVDSTMLVAAVCPQKFFQEYVLKLSTAGLSPDLHAGGAFAHAIQHARLAFYRDGLSVKESLESATYEFMKFWGDYEPPEHSPKDFVTVITALYDYFEHYPPATDHVQPYRMANGDPAVEFTFALPMQVRHPETGNPIIYGGRCDMVGQYAELIATVDEKTTKNTPSNPSRDWAMRGQFIGYNYAAQQHGINCSTAITRTIVLQKTQFKHIETINQYTRHQVERWWRNVNHRVQMLVDHYAYCKSFIKAYRESGEVGELAVCHELFPFNFGDMCSSYGGCEMLGLCTSDDPTIWYDDYDVRVWDPLSKDPTDKSPPLLTQTISWEDAIG